MAAVDRIRSFVAIDLAAPVLAAVGALQKKMAATQADVRWVRASGMHMTLKFLGSVDAARLDAVHAALAAVVSGHPVLHVRVRGVGAFPSFRRPRVLWVGLIAEGLVELAHAADAALAKLGFEPEKRAFTAHVTLGRVNSLRDWPRLETAMTQHLDDDFGASDVDAVTIYRSTLRRDGAVYTPLWTIPLSGNKERTTP